jgi:protoporphyrinogen oxidase
MTGLTDVLRMTLLPRQVKTQFIYPEKGCGQFCDILRERIEERGSHIVCSVESVRLKHTASRIDCVETDTAVYPAGHVVWTASLPVLCQRVGLDSPALGYMNTAVFNLILKSPPRRRDQWIYFSSKNIVFARISNPAMFNPANIPAGKGGLCVEVMCHDPAWWRHPEHLTDRVVKDLAHTGLCCKSDIEMIQIEKVKETYPVYTIDYPEVRRETLTRLAQFENLHPTGRCGAFFYNNMDDSIRMGLEVSRSLIDNEQNTVL